EEALNDVERAFIDASVERIRRDRRSRRRRRLTLAGYTLALALVTALLAFALVQRRAALGRGRDAGSAAMANAALLQMDKDPDRALISALDAALVTPSTQAATALREGLAKAHLRAVIPAQQVGSVAFSPNGMFFVTGQNDGSIRIWDTSTLEVVGRPLRTND